ncbi:MAG: hypothetical protein OEY01_11260 [Desulfobulbaceae bacterium]|nr:hypothetical protein [Desulfobulbaceae bacterium]HIJ79431.1 hypothetical protein [Deltaproteobacteria bacterium]
MRNKKMFRLLTLLCLALLAPTGIFAFERLANGLVDTPRTREIRANEPKTPEDLLLVLKSFMDNPQMSGYDIGEKISGIARENWGEPVGKPMMGGTWSYSPCMRGGLKKHVIDGKEYAFPTAKQTTPYYLADDCTIALEGQGTLRRITIGSFKETFCLTPALARTILGEPSSLELGSKGSLLLKYNIVSERRRYKIYIYCTTKQVTKGFDKPDGTFTDKDEFPKIFEERKNTCAHGISIYGTKQ